MTDDTAAGTRNVDVFYGPPVDQSWEWIGDPSGDRAFLITSTSWETLELWTTDGTAGGTVNLGRCDGAYTPPPSGTVAGGVLLFAGYDEDHGVELWRSDGTPVGTHLVADIASADFGGSNPHDFMTLGDSVLFFAGEGPARYALWRSDGTEAGTTVVHGEMEGQSAWTASATRVFFLPTRSRESLWTSDGTEAGTVRLTPPGVRVYGSLSAPVIKLGNRVFFSAWFPPSGIEPWVTDGTPQGTRMLADLNPERGGSSPDDFTVFAGKAWLTALRHLWKSDGTAQGTVAIGPELQDLHPRTTYGGRLWFTGLNGAGSTELWPPTARPRGPGASPR